VIENNLDALLFARTSQKLAALFGVDTDKQRLGASLAYSQSLRVHIVSNEDRIGGLSGSWVGFSLSVQLQADDSVALAT
jgi:hypothetical protein